MSDRTDDESQIDDDLRSGDIGQTVEQPTAAGDDLLGDEAEFDPENMQTSTGGGMGPESFPPEEDEDYSGNGAGRGPN